MKYRPHPLSRKQLNRYVQMHDLQFLLNIVSRHNSVHLFNNNDDNDGGDDDDDDTIKRVYADPMFQFYSLFCTHPAWIPRVSLS